MKYYFCDCPESLRLHKDGSLGDVALREDVEPILNSLQQLKAEIAALVNEHSPYAKICGGNYSILVRKLRQLSAFSNRWLQYRS